MKYMLYQVSDGPYSYILPVSVIFVDFGIIYYMYEKQILEIIGKYKSICKREIIIILFN